MTGHTVLTTMHTWNAPDVLADYRIWGRNLSLCRAMSAVVNLRMARKLCAHCKAEMSREEVSDAVSKVHGLSATAATRSPTCQCFTGDGLSRMRLSGYQGRIPFTNCSYARRIWSKKSLSTAVKRVHTARRRKRNAHSSSGWNEKAVAGETSIDEVLRVTTERSRNQHQ